MGIFDLFGKKDVTDALQKQLPYNIKTEFVPYKLKANSRSNSTLFVNIKNMTNEPVLSSVVIEVPDTLSFDQTGLQKAKEVRLGTLAPNEAKDARIDVFSGPATEKGDYTVTITAFIHYRDYAHVLNAMKKRNLLQVV
ncbi:MAG: hypothetical protein KGH72_02080 [Candidatus Micrarchaeota archaeon]|nr:hypothetical protein [Candidatus Micrarchaeota archaeon]